MAEPAYLDANIAIYSTGAEHPLKAPCLAVVEDIARNPARCWSSAEVLQELLHVFTRRRQAVRARETISVLVALLGSQIVPIEVRDVLWCLNQQFPEGIEARDRLHVSVMRRLAVVNIISADRTLDRIPGITRLDPASLPAWRDLVFG